MMNQYIYHIDGLLQMDGTNIVQYLVSNLSLENHMGDNHMLKSILFNKDMFIFYPESSYECSQCYYVLIYEKKPNIHCHNVNNLIR